MPLAIEQLEFEQALREEVSHLCVMGTSILQ